MEQEAAVRAEGSTCSCRAEWVRHPLETEGGICFWWGWGGASPRPPGEEQTALLSFSASTQIRVVLSPDLSGPLPQKWSHIPARKRQQTHHGPGAYTLPLVLLHVHPLKASIPATQPTVP